MYCYMGLMDGALNNDFWQSAEARRFAGARGDAIGAKFETELANKLRAQGLDATPRCRISAILDEKVPDELGDVDVLVVSEDGQRVWVVEAKNLSSAGLKAVARLSPSLRHPMERRSGTKCSVIWSASLTFVTQ